MKNFAIMITSLMFLISSLYAQNISWQRDEPEEIDLNLFHSLHVINLPTSETLQKGDLEFEISHRFIPTIKDGSKSLYGFDGPVNIRLALGYGITDRLNVTLGRSNVNDNVDLRLKYKTLQLRNKFLPVLISLRGGAAWNTDVPNRDASDNKNFQYYGQMIINTLYKEKLGLGLVPTYVYNSHIFCPDKEFTFTLGSYLQYYLGTSFSLMFEWNPVVSGFRLGHNPVSLGFELETGGHFFKIILSNSTQLNPSQFILGAEQNFNDGELHIGFNITRLLKI